MLITKGLETINRVLHFFQVHVGFGFGFGSNFGRFFDFMLFPHASLTGRIWRRQNVEPLIDVYLQQR